MACSEMYNEQDCINHGGCEWCSGGNRCFADYECGSCGTRDPISCECAWDDEKCPDVGCGYRTALPPFAIECDTCDLGPCGMVVDRYSTDPCVIDNDPYKCHGGPCGKPSGGGSEPFDWVWDDELCSADPGCGAKVCTHDLDGCRYMCGDCDAGCGATLGGGDSPCYIQCATWQCEGPCGEEPTGGGLGPCSVSTAEYDSKCTETGGEVIAPGVCDCGIKAWKDCDRGCICVPDQSGGCEYSGGSWDLEKCTCACPSGKIWNATAGVCECDPSVDKWDYCQCLHPDDMQEACKCADGCWDHGTCNFNRDMCVYCEGGCWTEDNGCAHPTQGEAEEYCRCQYGGGDEYCNCIRDIYKHYGIADQFDYCACMRSEGHSEYPTDCGPCGTLDKDTCMCTCDKCDDAGCGDVLGGGLDPCRIECGKCDHSGCGLIAGGGYAPCIYTCEGCEAGCGLAIGGGASPCYVNCGPCDKGPCGEEPTGGGANPCTVSTADYDAKCKATGGEVTSPGVCDCAAHGPKEWKDCDIGCDCDSEHTPGSDCDYEDPVTGYPGAGHFSDECECTCDVGGSCDAGDGSGKWSSSCHCECSDVGNSCEYVNESGDRGEGKIEMQPGSGLCVCNFVPGGSCYYRGGGPGGVWDDNGVCSCDGGSCERGGDWMGMPDCRCSCSSAAPCANGAEFDYYCGCDCSTASVQADDCVYGSYDDNDCKCVCTEGRKDACTESGGAWDDAKCSCDCGEGRSVDSEGHCRCDTDCPAGQHHVGYTCDCECDIPVGSECTVGDGDCAGHSGTVQSDCSCAVVCSGGFHPGDDCVSASALTSNGSKLNCDCECEETCTPGDPCTASHGVPGHYSADCVCMPDCTPGSKCPDGIHVYDQSCNCVCENTGACTVDVGDCKDVPGQINETTCACDPDCTPGSEECTYTDADGNVGDGVKDCQCECTCKKDGGSCAYDKKRPGKWTDDCTCTCDDVGSDCEFTDEKGSHGSGSIGDDCYCHCVVGGGCVYTYEGRPINGKFSTDCVCGCDDSEKESCIASGKGWDHLRCKCGCEDSDRTACANKGPHWTWVEDDCTCHCDMEAEMKPKCEQEPSHGSWVTESCACTCPEAKTLVGGECFCGGSKEEDDRNEEECKAGGGTEYDRMTCKCNCGEDKDWSDTDKKCVCKNLAQETEACNKLGFVYNDKDCKCSDCLIAETTKEVELCQSSPDPVDFDFDECKCKCKEEHRVRELTEEGVMVCSCDDEHYKKEKSDCNTPAKQNAGWTWVKDDCECKCTDWETKTCLKGDYPKGKRNSKCECECPPEAKSDTGCGEHMFYNSECKCDCVIGEKCTINPDIVDDGRMDKDENGRCYCKCNGGGDSCSITDKHTGQEITGLTTGPDCYCKCGDKVGTPCEWIAGDPSSGVLWDDCQCKCLEYHQFCTTDTIPYGQYDDNCECTCAPAGTKCLAADGTVGKVVNDGKGTCACECDYEKEAQDCENKQINDPVRKDGTPKTWEFSVNGCECKCADAGFDCWYENSEGELVPGKINADTCDCEDCNITAVTCLDPATTNFSDCNCECKGEGVPECPLGQHNVYDMLPPCGCTCDNDVDEEYCGMQPHQGDASDYLKLGEHCDCVCANANAECVMESGEKGYKRESDCKCVCGLTAETAGCNGSQDFDPEQCKCVCKKDLDDCKVGDRTWRPTEETKCLCTCDDVHDCKNSGSWLEYDESGEGCKCDCSNAELPADHKWYESEYVKFTDYDCTEYCTLTPAGCEQPGSYDSEHCDCRKCLRIQSEGCTGATPDYYEDESGCGCWCDVDLHMTPSCKEFDPMSCSCKQPCSNYDQEEVDRRAICDIWQPESCSFIPRPDSPWFGSRDVAQGELDKAITSLSALIASLVVPSNTPDVTICPCAQYFYKPDGHTVTGDCSSPALKEQVDFLKSKYSLLYKTVVEYHDAFASCKRDAELNKERNSKKECGASLATVPSCATDEDLKQQAMKQLADLRSVQTSIANISSSLSGYCTGGNTCKECESGGGGGGGGGGGDPDPEPTCSGDRYDASSYCDNYEADSDECYDCLLAKCYDVAATEGLIGYCSCVYGLESPEFLACYYSGGDYDRRYDPEDDPEEDYQ